MLVSTATLNSLRVGVQNIYSNAYAQVGASNAAWWNLLARRVPSSGSSEVYRFSETMNRLRRWIGPRQLRNLVEKSYTLPNVKFEQSYHLAVEDIEDDRWQNQMDGVRDIARAGALWPNDLIYDALVAGTSTVCFDGQYYFDTDHPLEVQGAAATTQSNLHTSTALTYANYVTVRTAIRNRLANDGKILGCMPSHLIVPPALEELGKRILTSDTLGYLANASSTASDSNPMKGTAELVVIPELTADSATSWYFGCLNHGILPLVFQERVAPSRIAMMNAPDDEAVFSEDIVRFGVRARGAGGYGLWQLLDKCEA